jgi:deazaflavin-dependent oxidoreductase (nitroreductase family)
MPGMDMRAVNAEVIRRFRAGEPIEGMHRERLVLLTTTGRRTREPRTAPMMFVDHDGDPLVIASADGAPRHPEWFRNLEADPHVTVETPDGSRRQAVAEVLRGEERARAWADLVAGYPFFADQQRRAGERVIPLVRLRTCA